MDKKQRQLATATMVANRHDDLHPWEVAVAACNRESKADFHAFLTGLLHDSIEDGYATEEYIRVHFPDEVADAVVALTRRDGEPYWDYIERIKSDSMLVRKVKLCDAEINLIRCQRSFGYETLEKRYRRVIEELSPTGGGEDDQHP